MIDANRWKLANIVREIPHIFWMTWVISMKFSGKMWLMIILKVTKNQGFTLSLEDTLFKKPQGGGSNWPHPVVLALKITLFSFISIYWGFACCQHSEAVAQSYSIKMMFLKIWKNTQENILVPQSLFNKVAGLTLSKVDSSTVVSL